MPRLLDGAPTFCCLPHSHAGWHKGDDGAEWGAPDEIPPPPREVIRPDFRDGLIILLSVLLAACALAFLVVLS